MKFHFPLLTASAALVLMTGCTAYIDPSGSATSTTTTRTTTDATYVPGASVTTEETTTSY